jgi:hypothetical protein
MAFMAIGFTCLYAIPAFAEKMGQEPDDIRLVTPPVWAAAAEIGGPGSVFHCSSVNVGNNTVEVLVQFHNEAAGPSSIFTHLLDPGDARSTNSMTVPMTTYACSFIIPWDAVDDIRVSACLSRGHESDCTLMVEPR